MEKNNKDYKTWQLHCLAKELGNIGEGSEYWHKILRQRKCRSLFGIHEFNRIIILKYLVPISENGYDITCIYIKLEDYYTITGYLFWKKDGKYKKPEYIINSYTYNSKDGEYRHQFIKYEIYEMIIEKTLHYLSPVQIELQKLITKSKLDLGVHHFPETLEKNTKKFNFNLLALNQVSFFILTRGYKISHKILSDHISLGFKYLINFVSNNKKLYSMISDEENFIPIKSTVKGFDFNVTPTGTIDPDAYKRALEVGIKFVPLSVRAVINPWDFNFSGWRELLCIWIASDIVINHIAPSFPIFNQFTYIEGTDRWFYENQAMISKYELSDSAFLSNKSLINAKKAIKSVSEDFENDIASYFGNIDDSIQFAQSYLEQSGKSLMLSMEHVGHTFGSLNNVLRRDYRLSPSVQNVFSKYEYGCGMLFILCHGIKSLHKFGIIHTDLHKNNITLDTRIGRTIYRLKDEKYIKYCSDPFVAFICGNGQKDTFFIPFEGTMPYIIDFSRVLLYSGEVEKRMKEKHGELFVELFYKDQCERVISTIYRYMPSMKKYEDTIRDRITRDWPTMYHVLKAIDYMSLGKVVSHLISEFVERDKNSSSDDKRQINTEPKLSKLGDKIFKHSHEIFSNNMEIIRNSKIVYEAGAEDNLDDNIITEGPSVVWKDPTPFIDIDENILHKMFGKYLFDHWYLHHRKRLDECQLPNLWNFNNNITYSTRDFKYYPDWLKYDKIDDHLKGEKMSKLFGIDIDNFLNSQKFYKYMQEDAKNITKMVKEKTGGQKNMF